MQIERAKASMVFVLSLVQHKPRRKGGCMALVSIEKKRGKQENEDGKQLLGKIRVTCDGLTDFTSWLEENAKSETFTSGDRLASRRDETPSGSDWDWFGEVTYKGALALARDGWKHGLTKVAEALEALESSMTDEKAGYRWDVTGDFFDVGALLTGEPEHWMTDDFQPIRKVYRIVINSCASSGATPQQLINRGSAICGLADHLQSGGAIVEIINSTVFTGISGPKAKADEIRVDVPIGMTPLDLDATAYTTGHPSFLRRIGFSICEFFLGGYCGGYGQVADIPTEEQQGCIYFPGSSWSSPNSLDHFNSEASSREWVERTIAEINEGKHQFQE
jgi:hypothetical protein